MARQKNTKTHNIFLIDKNKLPGISGVPAPSIADVLATLMSIDERYKLQTLKPNIDTKGFSICLYFRGFRRKEQFVCAGKTIRKTYEKTDRFCA